MQSVSIWFEPLLPRFSKVLYKVIISLLLLLLIHEKAAKVVTSRAFKINIKKTPPPHWKRREVTMFPCQICSKDFRRGDNTRRYVKTVHADFKDDETIDDRENPENIEAVHADIKDDKTIDDRRNPESIEEEDASDKADDDEPNIQDKTETDDSDIDVEEEEEEEEEEDKEEDSDDP